jgi:PKD repeat protein
VCTASYPVTIHGKPTPVITPSFTAGCGSGKEGSNHQKESCLIACDSTYITYSTPLHAGSTYSWTISGTAVYTASGNSVNVFWTGTGAGSVKVKEINQWGCEKETEVCVEIVGRPKAAFSALPSISSGVIYACKNQTIQFTDLSSPGTGKPINSWSWYFGDTNTDFISGSGPGHTSHAYASSGVYTVMLVTENECHCRDTAYVKVKIAEDIGPDIYCISTVCPGNTATYHTNATGCTNYQWTVGNGTPLTSTTDSVITVQWGNNGPGVLTLSVNCPGYCNAPTTVYVPVITPNATIQGPAAVCQNQCYTYKISCDIPVNSIKWTFPPGFNVSTSTVNAHEVKVCFGNTVVSGNISVNYFHKTPGSTTPLSCGGKADLFVSVKPQMFPYGNTILCEKQAFSYNVSPVTSGNILWTVHNSSGTLVSATTLPSGVAYAGTWTYGAGNFVVTATDVSGNYCNSPQKINLTVNPIPAKPTVITGPGLICPGNSYSYASVPSSSNLTMGWNVSAGSPATGVGNSTSVTWASSGSYNISAYQMDPVTGCKSDTIMKPISSILPLTPSPITGPSSVCKNSDVNFSTTATGDDFVWSINSGLAGSIKAGQHTQNVTVQWNNYSGTAWLVLKRTVCGTSRKDSVLITVSGPPVPVVTAPSSVCAGVAVSASSSGAVSYSWNFGDGFTASGNPASHVYSAPGNYVITVSATYGSSCPGTVTGTKTITVLPKPDINISTPDPNEFCNLPVSTNMFVAAPVGGVTYQWYNPATIPAATTTTYSATTPGNYFVVGTNSYGCKDTSNVIPVKVINCQPCRSAPYVLDFNRFRLGCNTDSFNFWSSAGVINHKLTFDDPYNPAVATSSPATHTFSEPGYYRIKLCADVPNTTGTGYCPTCIYKTDTVKYVPGFYDSTYCVNNSGLVKVKLVNTTKILTGYPAPSWNWTINPGAITSTAQSPLVNLAPGTYTVSLNAGGVCTFTKTIVINALPVAAFAVADSFCVGKPVIFTNTSTGLYNYTAWTFGDASSSLINSPVRTYGTAGNYNVVLTIQNAYGCTNTVNKNVTVLPNTLNGTLVNSGFVMCEGDSISLLALPTSGYPAYQYLWSTTQTSPSIYVKQTGTYYAELSDTKGCYFRTGNVNVLAFAKPKPVISGKTSLCIYNSYQYTVNYPLTAGVTFNWELDGVASGTAQSFYYYPSSAGNHTLVLNIVDAKGCKGTDTLKFSVYPNPSVTISSTGVLCAGSPNVLTAVSPSPGIAGYYWSNGLNGPVITTGTQGTYTVTVTDTNSCKASASVNVNPLPDLCGLMTGCYEICDTVKSLLWHAPAGYASYQWNQNGNAIPGATSSVLSVPLYQDGLYTVDVKNSAGCLVKSETIEINFVKCGRCNLSLKAKAACGPVSEAGNQTYTVTFSINNTLGAGANLSVNTTGGTVTGITPSVLAAGVNTVTAVFEDTPPVTTRPCFNVVLYNKEQKCDTTICMQLPDCNSTKCTIRNKLHEIICAGKDANGNPQYQVCLDIYWGGSNGSSLSLATASGTFTPNPVTVNNGSQTLCFNYTDLTPYGNYVVIYTSYFDPATGKVCRDSVKFQHESCPDQCALGIYGECAHCSKEMDGAYDINLTVLNPFAGSASVSILPSSGGTFTSINPNPVPSGMQVVNAVYSGPVPSSGIICFKVLLTDLKTGRTCVKEVCLALPQCDPITSDDAGKDVFRITVHPNPGNQETNISYESTVTDGKITLEIVDVSGKVLYKTRMQSSGIPEVVNTTDLAPGVYMVKIIRDGEVAGIEKLMIAR